MKLGVYGDVHAPKNMRTLQDAWEKAVVDSIREMYDYYDRVGIEMAICLGDFFNDPRIEAKHLHFILPLLEDINRRTYPTMLLLGNHEIDDDEHNILEFLSEYENIIPVTSKTVIDDILLFIPYNRDLDDPDIEYEGRYVFTHHDIYGSELAGGKTKAFFGVDPQIFSKAKLVMNGHVHLKSKVAENVINAGSLLASAQGELKVGDYPSYYVVDTKTGDIVTLPNPYSLIYITIDSKELTDIMRKYEESKLVLKVEYSGEIPESTIEPLHMSYRKIVSDIGENTGEIVHMSTFDLKNYLVDYIKKDESISENEKDSYIKIGLEMLK